MEERWEVNERAAMERPSARAQPAQAAQISARQRANTPGSCSAVPSASTDIKYLRRSLSRISPFSSNRMPRMLEEPGVDHENGGHGFILPFPL